MWCFHAEEAYPKKSSFPSPLCLSKLPPFKMLSKENVYLLWQRTTYQPRNPQSAIFHSWDQYSRGVEEGTLKSCIFSRKAATPQQKQVEWIRDEKTETEGAAIRRLLRVLVWQRLLGTKLTRPHGESKLNKAWNNISDGLLMELRRQDHIEPSCGSCSEYPTLMLKKTTKKQLIMHEIPTWNHQAAVKDLKCQCSAFTSPA